MMPGLPRVLRLLYDYRAASALTVLAILLGVFIGYALLYDEPGWGKSRRARGTTSTSFMSMCTLVKEPQPVCKPYVVLALGIVSTGNLSVSLSMSFCGSVTLLQLSGLGLNLSKVFPVYSRSVYGPKVVIREPGFYVLFYNVSARESFMCRGDTNKVAIYVSENGPRIALLRRSLFVLVGAIGVALLVYLYYRLSGLSPGGWSTGLSLAPFFGLAYSLIYVLGFNPLMSRALLLDTPYGGLSGARCSLAAWFLERLSPASHYVSFSYWVLWFFLAMGAALLLWATPVETRIHAYEYLVEPRLPRLFLFKLVTGVGVAVFSPLIAFLVSVFVSYPGLLGACLRASLAALAANFVVLLLYALAVELLTALVALATGRGSVSAIIVSIVLVVSLVVYRLRSLFFLATTWRDVYEALLGDTHLILREWSIIAELLGAIVLLLFSTYLLYTRREVVI